MRLIDEADVVKAIDKHTQPDGTLDDDISCILEEVQIAFDKEKVIEKIKCERDEAQDYNQYSAVAAHEIDIEILKKGGIE